MEFATFELVGCFKKHTTLCQHLANGARSDPYFCIDWSTPLAGILLNVPFGAQTFISVPFGAPRSLGSYKNVTFGEW